MEAIINSLCSDIVTLGTEMNKKLQELQQQYDALKAERDALAAHVEALRRDKSDLLAYALDAEKWFNNHDPNGYVSPKREDAQHHLRELRAEAGRAGYLKGADDWKPYGQVFDSNIKSSANQYADKVRRGEVE